MCNVLFTIDFSSGNGYFKLFLSDEYLLWLKIRYFYFWFLRFGHYGWQYIIMVIFYFPNILNWISI